MFVFCGFTQAKKETSDVNKKGGYDCDKDAVFKKGILHFLRIYKILDRPRETITRSSIH